MILARSGAATDRPEVDTSEQSNEAVDLSSAPRNGIRLMVVILAGLALVAIYANVQKLRRAQIETVTILPAPPATLAPGPGNF